MADFDPRPAAARIDLAEEPDFDLGGMRVKPSERAVVLNGERLEIQPRVMKVLIALAQAVPAVVSRDRLGDLCWDGRIVGDDALNRCILVLRHLADQFTPAPFAIETVPRVGHRLVEGPRNVGAIEAPRMRWKPWGVMVALGVILLAAAVAFFVWNQRSAVPDPASIAVLPFRNLSSGEPYFAEGIGEEIRGQLAREPQFQVAGGTSSSQWGNRADIRKVARGLNVDYVLEGSVRTQGDRVRVNANLVRASDGIRLWSDSYDGNLDDIFAIQQRIGGAIAGALRRRLVRAPALSGPLVTSGEAYNLYLTARGLLRTRQREVGETAASLLRDAINLDPGYAPAWASLAAAVQLQGALHGHEGLVAALPRAQGYARHALRLAPDLSEAHRTLGMLYGYGTPEARLHLRRAAALAPNDAENMIWLGVVHGASGEFEQELAAYRRAADLDPLWFRTVGHSAVAVAEMGNRAEAEAGARRAFPNNEIQQRMLLAHIASIFGDFSEAARHWSIVARSGSPRWRGLARRSMNEATFAVGLRTGPLVVVPPPPDKPRVARVWMDAPPVAAVWQERTRQPIAAQVYRGENHMAAKLMLGAGRASELAAAYGSAVGLFGLRPRHPLRVDQVHEAPVVALALREAGRTADADRLLREADATIRAVYRRGRVPFWFDADAAAIWAVQGRTNEALSALERALGRGWRHSGNSDLRNLADEPAFFSLRDEPRFARIKTKVAAHYARERTQTMRLRIQG